MLKKALKGIINFVGFAAVLAALGFITLCALIFGLIVVEEISYSLKQIIDEYVEGTSILVISGWAIALSVLYLRCKANGKRFIDLFRKERKIKDPSNSKE